MSNVHGPRHICLQKRLRPERPPGLRACLDIKKRLAAILAAKRFFAKSVRSSGSAPVDVQRPADAPQGQAIDEEEHGGQYADHCGADAHAGQLPGGEAVVVEVHNHDIKGGDEGGARQGGGQEHLGDLPPHGAEQVGVGGAQTAQVVIDPGVGQGDGHTAGKGDHDHCREADERDEDEQQQIDRHGGDKVVPVQHPELGHVEPGGAELRGISVVVVAVSYTHLHGVYATFQGLVQSEVRQAGDVTGRNVAVLGAGPIGNLVAQAAKACGASKVLISDVSDLRLDKALECGVDAVVNTAKEDFGEAMVACFGPDKADVIYDCAANDTTMGQAIKYARKGSTIILVGVYAGMATVDLAVLNDHELDLNTTMMYRHPDYLDAIRFVNEGAIQLRPLMSRHFAFADYAEAYRFIDANRETSMKILIDVDGED